MQEQYKAEQQVDTRITVSVTTSAITDITAAVRTWITIPVIPGFTSQSGTHTAGSGYWFGLTAIPIGRVFALISLTSPSKLSGLDRLPVPHHESEFSDHAVRQLASVQFGESCRDNNHTP